MQTLRPQHVAATVIEQYYTETYGTTEPWPYALTLLAISMANHVDTRMKLLATAAIQSQDALTQEAILGAYDVHYSVREAINSGEVVPVEPLPVQSFGEELGLSDDVQRKTMVRRVIQECDRRLLENFVFNDKPFDFDLRSQTRIAGAAALAQFASLGGADPEDLYWHGGDEPFTWITKDNEIITLTAPQCFALGQAAAEHETNHIFAARTLKDMEEIPADFAEDIYWPTLTAAKTEPEPETE